ncbi:hypothetical protein ACFQO4_15040 [Saliphagus sp. GCM10025334]
MNPRLGIAGVTAIALGLTLLVVSSGAGSSVALERPIDVRIGDVSQDAFEVGVREPRIAAGSSQTVDLLEVTNRETEAITVLIEVDSSAHTNATEIEADPPGEIAVGPHETVAATATVACPDRGGNFDVPITVVVESAGTVVETDDTLEVTCELPSEETARDHSVP